MQLLSFSSASSDRLMAINCFGQRLTTIITATGSGFPAICRNSAYIPMLPLLVSVFPLFFFCFFFLFGVPLSLLLFQDISFPNSFSTINCRVNSFVRSIRGSGTPVGYRCVNRWNPPPTTQGARPTPTPTEPPDSVAPISHSILNANGHPLID